MKSILSMNHICKQFPGVKALNDVSLEIKEGEVHAIVGENGAGKSTLMKILAGIYRPDSGEIILDGKPVRFSASVDALKHGVAMVHQELMPVLDMSIAENIFLGREPVFAKTGIVNNKQMIEEAKKLLKELHVDIDPKREMRSLNVAQMQLVEIAKAISCNAKIIIMDEPTSAITQKECDNLFLHIEKLKKDKVSIIYISHKWDEIFEICDRITVLRDGNFISVNKVNEIDVNSMITEMVGRKMEMIYPEGSSVLGEVLLEVKNIDIPGLLHNISFNVRHGEILGIAGLMGAGRTELVECIFGMRRKEGGEVFKDGKSLNIQKPIEAIRNGIALVPEDRKSTGLNLIADVEENIAMASLDKYTKYGIVNQRKIRSDCDDMIDQLNIKTTGYTQIVDSLSGGNQQKIVFGKWLLTDSDVIILDDPTRGIDVHAKYEIYTIIRKLSQLGKGIIMISSEMPEIIGICDRAIVMYEGRITGEIKKGELSQELIMRYASGITD